MGAIIFSIWIYLRKFIKSFIEIIKTIKKGYAESVKRNGKFSIWLIRNLKRTITNKTYLKGLLKEALLIKSTAKASTILYALSFAVAVELYQSGVQYNNAMRIIFLLLTVIFLSGIAKFLSFRFDMGFLGDITFYIFKISFFVVFAFTFIQDSFKDISNIKFLFIGLSIILFFSVYLLKHIIDYFKSTVFFIVNFLLIYLFNIALIGLCFGYYYLTKNGVYNLFDNPISYLNSSDLVTVMSVIFKGLTYFYSSPISTFTKDIDHLVPFFEYVFGYVVNIGIIGFFLSYVASKVYSNKKDKKVNW